MYLGFHYGKAAAVFILDLPVGFLRLVSGAAGESFLDRNLVALEQFLGLVFVKIHLWGFFPKVWNRLRFLK